jgi:hypothetical protein
MKPPPLPSEILRRVLRVATFDGTCVLVIAAAGALISASWRDVTGAAVGLLVAGAASMELHGAGVLRAGDERGMRWLVSSQLCIMASILGYVGVRLANPDIASLRKFVTPEMADQIQQAGMTVDQFLTELPRIFAFAVAVATIVFQGAMAVYYLRKAPAVAEALREDCET